MFRRKPGGKDGMQRVCKAKNKQNVLNRLGCISIFLNDLLLEKDYRTSRGLHRDDHQPEYEAWRAERNRIDEDRISRQRTAEGNWRREWDNDKVRAA